MLTQWHGPLTDRDLAPIALCPPHPKKKKKATRTLLPDSEGRLSKKKKKNLTPVGTDCAHNKTQARRKMLIP